MMNGLYLTFEGQRKKKTGKSRWTDIETSIPMSEIRKVALVDNSNTAPCNNCKAYNREEDYIDRDNCYYSNCRMGDEEEESYIEVEDDTYIYQFCQCFLFNFRHEKDFLEKIFLLIKEGTQNVDIPMIKREIEQKEEEAQKARMRENRQKEYKRRLKQKEKCGKCSCLQDENTCLFGYRVIEGMPQEPCIRPLSKRYINEDKELIEEFKGE